MTDDLATAYDAERARLVRVAYAILGSHAEAEDVVADCWLRLVAADERAPVHDVGAWATVTVARAALDVLRSARVRREAYVGPWLPEPVVAAVPDAADWVSLDDSVRYALLAALERLTPAERGVRRRRCGSSRAGPAGTSRRGRRGRRSTRARTTGWSAPSWVPRPAATSRAWCGCSTRAWC